MGVVSVLVYVLEGIFAIGILGSFIVLILTTWEDSKMLMEKGESERTRLQSSTEQSAIPGRSHKVATT